jgi:hypothetical protein
MSALSVHVLAAVLTAWVLLALALRAARSLSPRSRARRRERAALLAALRAPGGWVEWRTAAGTRHIESYPNRAALEYRVRVLRALGTPVRVTLAPTSAVRPADPRPSRREGR